MGCGGDAIRIDALIDGPFVNAEIKFVANSIELLLADSSSETCEILF